MLKFSATWCGPCHNLDAHWTAAHVQSRYPDLEFQFIDVDERPDLTDEYQITAMPTVVLLHHGQEIQRIKGAAFGVIDEAIEKLHKLE